MTTPGETFELDGPLRFYLRNEAQIETWLARKADVIRASDAFFQSLKPQLQAACAEIDGTPGVFQDQDQVYANLFLCRPAWIVKHTEIPRAAIGLEWQRNEISFTRAYFGVWINQRFTDGVHLSKRLRRMLDERGADLPAQRDAWWPAGRRIMAANGAYWSDLPTYSTHIVQTLTDLWREYYPLIEEAAA